MFSRTAPLYIKPRLDRELVSWLWNFHLHCNQRYLDRCMETLCAMGWQTLDVLERIEATRNREDARKALLLSSRDMDVVGDIRNPVEYLV